MARLGILPLGRPTFDVEFAGEKLTAMLARLDAEGHELVGPRELLFDADATRAGLAEVMAGQVDAVLVLQVTFTDAAMVVEIANTVEAPLAIWAVPEPRLGGRLRLNAFCGLNLAAHALGLSGKAFGWAYAEAGAVDLARLLDQGAMPAAPQPVAAVADDAATAIAATLSGRRIARIGARPDGFDTCDYDPEALNALAGVQVDALELDTLFDLARAAPAPDALHAQVAAQVPDLGKVDRGELDRSLRLRLALDQIRASGKYDAFAIRCWPETFTEYGGAVCGPVSQLGEARVPCACEAETPAWSGTVGRPRPPWPPGPCRRRSTPIARCRCSMNSP